jgi:hypothetical protein
LTEALTFKTAPLNYSRLIEGRLLQYFYCGGKAPALYYLSLAPNIWDFLKSAINSSARDIPIEFQQCFSFDFHYGQLSSARSAPDKEACHAGHKR